MLQEKKEGLIWQRAYNKACAKTFSEEYARLIGEGVDESEARHIARDNSDQKAKDKADAVLYYYRRERK